KAALTWPPPVPDAPPPSVSPAPKPRGSTFSRTSSQAAPQAGPSALQMPVQEKREPERHSKDRAVRPGRPMLYYQHSSTVDPLDWTQEPTCSCWGRVFKVALWAGYKTESPQAWKGGARNPLGQ
ncbi:unnamed protein product, partial [Gulo gulo]